MICEGAGLPEKGGGGGRGGEGWGGGGGGGGRGGGGGGVGWEGWGVRGGREIWIHDGSRISERLKPIFHCDANWVLALA